MVNRHIRRHFSRDRRISLTQVSASLLLCLFLALTMFGCKPVKAKADSPAPANVDSSKYRVRVTQQDTTEFPKIRLYISITDSEGNPLPDNLRVKLSVFEDGVPVLQNTISEGWTVCSVLALDVSGSMEGDKLAKAKEAAINYLNSAPPSYKIAVIAFSDTPWVVGDFNYRRATLEQELRGLKTQNLTALQDGIALALDMLADCKARKVITVLTDGKENHSKRYRNQPGYDLLLQRAEQENCSIFSIGLGDKVEGDYLKRLEKTGGTYMFAPTAQQLRSLFDKAVHLLNQELAVEYTSPDPSKIGTNRNLSFVLTVEDETANWHTAITTPGVIPHIPANHLPWLFVILALALAPSGYSFLRHFAAVYQFRSSSIVRLTRASRDVGKHDPNEGPESKPFEPGDLVVKCPARGCNAAHRVRSWRFNGCRCMREGKGKGSYCYQRILPLSVRHKLDEFTNGHIDPERGRQWLCYCAGDRAKDKAGY